MGPQPEPCGLVVSACEAAYSYLQENYLEGCDETMLGCWGACAPGFANPHHGVRRGDRRSGSVLSLEWGAALCRRQRGLSCKLTLLIHWN